MTMKIGEVSQQFNLPISTLHYYDRQGFFPDMERAGGQRLFGDKELSTIEVVECLKKSGLSIQNISEFIQWCQEGDTTLHERLNLFRERKNALDEQLAELRKIQAMLLYKIWYYETAIALGSEAPVKEMPDDDIPADILEARTLAGM
ncbi:MerR family transcriptional regulator [Arcanobacterium haemolyticum]|nr:MerR family transcriptional regulator [Arcanobacterium haemolyticum]